MLDATADRNALSWIRALQLVRLDNQTAHVVAALGKRDVLKFLSDRQKGQLADLLFDLTHQRFRVELDQSAQEDSASAALRASSTMANHTARREAMSLPLVKQVLDVFDAEVIDVREENKCPSDESNEPNETSD